MNSNHYDRQFFEGHLHGAIESARHVVPILLEHIPVSSVVDVGCGLGAWLSVFADHGINDYLGVDGDYVDRDQLVIPADRFIPVDLRQRLVFDRRFDLVLSLEVAEHLPEACAEQFVSSLVDLGNVILFSASIPHQEGTDHINEQWPDYWADLFERYGFVALDFLRPLIWRNERVSWWYSQNAVLYVHENLADHYSALTAVHKPQAARPLPFVHPQIFLHKEWRLSQLNARNFELEGQIAQLEQRIAQLTSAKYLFLRLPSHAMRHFKKLTGLG